MKATRKHVSTEHGFTLIELLIVVAIIGILVGIVVPTWQSGVRKGNEASAIKTLQAIAAEEAKYSIDNRGEYGTFDQLLKAGYLDERFGEDSPVVSGYIFNLKVTPKAPNRPPTYSVNADPQQPEGVGATGTRFFYIDPNVSTIRVNKEGPASRTDPPL